MRCGESPSERAPSRKRIVLPDVCARSASVAAISRSIGLVGAREAREIELRAEPAPAREDLLRGPHHHHVRQRRRPADARSLQDEHVHPGVHLEPAVLVEERNHLHFAVVHLRRPHVRPALDEEDRAPRLGRAAGDDAARGAGADHADIASVASSRRHRARRRSASAGEATSARYRYIAGRRVEASVAVGRPGGRGIAPSRRFPRARALRRSAPRRSDAARRALICESGLRPTVSGDHSTTCMSARTRQARRERPRMRNVSTLSAMSSGGISTESGTSAPARRARVRHSVSAKTLPGEGNGKRRSSSDWSVTTTSRRWWGRWRSGPQSVREPRTKRPAQRA